MNKLLGLPPLASEHGADVDKLIIYLHWVMGILFIGWILYFFYVLFRFHKSRNPQANYIGARTHASTYIEGAVAIVEGVLLIGFAIPLWARAVDKFPAEKDSTVIRIMAQQFSWNYWYPGKDGIFGKQDIHLISQTNVFGWVENDPNGKDDIKGMNELHVPVDKPVIIYLSSKDVIHSFKLIPMRVTQDAIPGMRIPVWFKPTQVGKFQINCAQLCGNGHYSMVLGNLIVEKPEDYQKWLESKSKAVATTATSFE